MLNGVTIVSNNATPPVQSLGGPAAGGGIYSRSGIVTAAACQFSYNVVYARHAFYADGLEIARGGGICMEGGSLQITDCLLQRNTAQGGSGYEQPALNFGTDAAGAAIYSDCPASVQQCRFLNNSASAGPGAGATLLYGGTHGGYGGDAKGAVHTLGMLQLTDCTFANNVASGGTGGSGIDASAQVNTPGGSGGRGGSVHGAVIFNAGSLSVANCTFSTNFGSGGNAGSAGKGIYSGTGGTGGSGGSVFGGAIFTANGSVYLTNCTIERNTLVAMDGQAGGGGGICLNCTGGTGGRGGNGGTAGGGGLYFLGGTSVIVHCSIDRNSVRAGTNGLGGPGGLGRFGPAPGGPAGIPGVSPGGALSVAAGNVQALNSIFSRSQGSTNCSGPLMDLGVNICSDESSCFTNPASLKNVDADLQPLTDNGGLTLTAALLSTSPAYNRGSNTFAPSTDQRGVPRPQGRRCDVGAYEIGYLWIEKSGDTALIRYGAPQGSFYRLQGRPNWNDWRDLGGDNARADGYVRFGPIPMTNQLEVFRTVKP